jgi:hypothetical protein
MKRLIKHADIHLRIRTLIAEDGRKLRAATETIKDEKAADSMVSAFCTRVPVTWGCPEVTRVHVKQMILPTIICRARSTLRAPFRMAVPPVLSSTSAEYSLQEVKGCTMFQPAWHGTASVGYNGKRMEMH